MTEELGIYIQPISPELPAGEIIRYLPIWNELQDMRRQEDERLPKGAWQRAPVRADFRRLEELCSEILTSATKRKEKKEKKRKKKKKKVENTKKPKNLENKK